MYRLAVLAVLLVGSQSWAIQINGKSTGERVAEIRVALLRGGAIPGHFGEERLDVATALVAIIKSESQAGSDWKLKCMALDQLENFGEFGVVKRVLFDNLQFKREQWSGSPPMPLDLYPAARALRRIGTGVREILLGGIWTDRLSDRDLSLRAHILLELDEEDDAEVTIFRLQRARRKCENMDGQAEIIIPDEPSKRAIGLENLNRMISMLQRPNFRYERIPDAP